MQQPVDPMAGVDIKIERAKQLVADLAAKIEQFFQSGLFQAVEGLEPDAGDWVVRARILAQPPLEWSAIIGDAVHNLRSA